MEIPHMPLQANNLCCLKGDRLLFRGLTLRLQHGMLMRVCGANGAGKSSLLRILAGLASPEDGQVLWQGTPIAACRDALHRNLLYLGHAAAVHDLLSPVENLRHACTSAGESPATDAIDTALRQAGLARQADLPLRLLSQGQRRRASLARLFLSHHRPLWILDEPFAALDADAIDAFSQAIARHCTQGGMTVLTTHQDIPLDIPVSRLELQEAA